MERILANLRSFGKAQEIQGLIEAITSESQRLGDSLDPVTIRPEEDAALNRIGQAFHQIVKRPQRGQDVVATLQTLRHDVQQFIANLRGRRTFIL